MNKHKKHIFSDVPRNNRIRILLLLQRVIFKRTNRTTMRSLDPRRTKCAFNDACVVHSNAFTRIDEPQLVMFAGKNELICTIYGTAQLDSTPAMTGNGITPCRDDRTAASDRDQQHKIDQSSHVSPLSKKRMEGGNLAYVLLLNHDMVKPFAMRATENNGEFHPLLNPFLFSQFSNSSFHKCFFICIFQDERNNTPS